MWSSSTVVEEHSVRFILWKLRTNLDSRVPQGCGVVDDMYPIGWNPSGVVEHGQRQRQGLCSLGLLCRTMLKTRIACRRNKATNANTHTLVSEFEIAAANHYTLTSNLEFAHACDFA